MVATFAADFDDDLDVDGSDFLIWQRNFGLQSGATSHDGDADGDGDVDGEDFLTWQRQFGSVAGTGGLSVPEPTSLTLLALAVAVTAAWRQKRRECVVAGLTRS